MSQKDIDKLDSKDRPYIERYPALREWLNRHNGRCLSQDAVGENYYEKWIVAGKLVLIEVRARQDGFEIWTPADSIRVDETFAEVERRLGIDTGCRTEGCKNRNAIGGGGFCAPCLSQKSL